MKKKLNMKTKRSLIAVVIVVIVIVFASIALFNDKNKLTTSNRNNKKTNEIDTAPTPYPVDTENDGVYTNYEFGYTFKYPAEKFKQTFSNNNGAGWELITSGEGRNSKVKMSLVNYTNSWNQTYLNLSKLDTGEKVTIKNSNMTKLNSIDSDGYKLVIFYSETEPDAETEHSNSYSAAWILNNKDTIVLSLYINPEEPNSTSQLESMKKVFDEIVDSFQLIDNRKY